MTSDSPSNSSEPADHTTVPTAWESYTAPTYNHQRSTNTAGVWFLGHQPSNDEPVELSHQMPLSPDMSLRDVAAAWAGAAQDSPARGLLHAQIMPTELGYVATYDLAKAFVDHARSFRSDLSPEALLLESGFVFEHEIPEQGGDGPTRVFRQTGPKRGTFTVMLSSQHLWMMHEKRGATWWSNLMRVQLNRGPSGKMPYWPSDVPAPLAAAAAFTKTLALTWTPEMSERPKPAKPKARKP